ncbi:MAG TPA: two-component regulator propeller domain-containing protein [Paludibacteraceae bacterium]|nr:two-component regulator propeller domain-containing protein [Paludibacteraceae bacterium]
MYKKLTVLLGIIVLGFSLQAQVAMGKWRTHFAYNTVTQIVQSKNKIYAVSDGMLFSIDKRDGGMEFYSKLTGLNGTTISRIGFDQVNNILLIIYQDGNIDFMSASGVKNLPDFYNKQISANKGVNHILFFNNMAYLSCNFGVITLNMKKMEIRDTYYIGPNASEVKVLNTTLHNGSIYAATTTDIFYATATDPNLINYENWQKLNALPGSGEIQGLVSFGSRLVLQRGGKLYIKGNDDIWSDLEKTRDYISVQVIDGHLLALTDVTAYLFNEQLVLAEVNGLSNLRSGLYDAENGEFWFAGDPKGVARCKDNTSAEISYFKPDGPAVNIPYRMRFSGQRLFVVPGGRWSAQFFRAGAVMIYENNIWKNISNNPISAITGKRVLDFMDIAIDPADNKHFLVSSYGTGVYEFKNDEFVKWYNFKNSLLETVIPDNFEYMRIDGGIFDDKGNVWFTNTSGSKQIKILKPDSTWMGLYYKELEAKYTLGEVLISNQNKNQKWIPGVRAGVGIEIFDDNGTLEDQRDDKSVFYSTFPDTDKGGVISPTNVFSIAQDRNGVVWLGTNEGPLLFNNPSKAFDAGFTCSRVKIPRNNGTNAADYLLIDEQIMAIAIDGANRKWLGTRSSGVYLMSENGQETIRHFTTNNSPLLSNEILSIAINPVTGEVFFGTGNGLVSYQSDAANADDIFNNVHAYPNPVRENYSGIITITGLVADTKVKITDLTGNVVCDTTSNGSIATWDGKNIFGNKVSTGVYLAICVSPDGLHSTTTKILVIN